MNRKDKAISFLVCAFIFSITASSLAQETFPFTGEITSDKINIRSDSTAGADIICTVNKGTRLEIILERYEWYKIRLPSNAPSYIKMNLVECINPKTPTSADKGILTAREKICEEARVTKGKVNIRLGPSESSAILGKAIKDEALKVVGITGDWYEIKPTQNCFGWINKRFVKRQ